MSTSEKIIDREKRAQGPTAGPWKLTGRSTIRTEDAWIARVLWYNQANNARLIAAAPTLLNMVKWCVSHDGECLGDHPALLTVAVAAIAEIEGTTT